MKRKGAVAVLAGLGAICLLFQSCLVPILPGPLEEEEKFSSADLEVPSVSADTSSEEPEPQKPPAFLSAGVPVGETVRRLPLEEIEEEEFLYLQPLGEKKLLLIGEKMQEDGRYRLRLMTYDPYEDSWGPKRILYSPYGESMVQVVNERVYILEENTLHVWDDSLSPAEEYAFSLPENVIPCRFAAGKEKIYVEDLIGNIYSGEIAESGERIDFFPIFEGCFYSYMVGGGDENEKLLVDTLDSSTLRRECRLLDMSSGAVTTLGQSDTMEAAFSREGNSSLCLIQEGSTVFCVELPKMGGEPIEREYICGSESFLSLEKSRGLIIGCHAEGKKSWYSGYNPRGERISAFPWDGLWGSISIEAGTAWFEDESCLAMIYNGQQEKGLLFWLLENPVSQWPQLEDMETTQAVAGEPAPAEGEEMQALYERAQKLGEIYGVEIQVGNRLDIEEAEFSIEIMEDEEIISKALDELEKALSRYPNGFFSQLCFGNIKSIKIAVTGPLLNSENPEYISEAGGYTRQSGRCFEMALSVSNGVESLPLTLYHETSHLIDRRLAYRAVYTDNCLFSEESWNSYNPDGFSYDYAYNGPHYTNGDWIEGYFLNSYSMTYPTEDRAVLMEEAMGLEEWQARASVFAQYPALREKYSYYCQCIRDGFDTEGWPEVAAWEEIPHVLGQEMRPAA